MTRTLRRAAAMTATATAAMLALSGCLSVTADLDISSDAKASGTVSVGLQKEAASLLGITDLDAFTSGLSDQGAEAGVSGTDVLALGECTTSETDTEFLQTCTLTDATLDDPTGWSATKEGDTIVFTVVSEAQEGQEQLLGDASLGDLSITVTFPGPITSISGEGAAQTSDTEATVTGSLSAPLDVRITSESSGGGGLLRTLLIVGGILLLIIVIAVVVFAVLRGRSGSAPDAVAPAADADAAAAAEAPVEAATEAPVEAPAQSPAEAPVEAPAEAPTEPGDEDAPREGQPPA